MELIDQVKKTIFAKLPMTVVLFAISFVEDNHEERVDNAIAYIGACTQICGEAAKTLFGITHELINEGKALSLFDNKEPSIQEISAILDECFEKLLISVDEGFFTIEDIQEIYGHLYQLAYEVMLPESESPEDNEGVALVFKAMNQFRRTLVKDE